MHSRTPGAGVALSLLLLGLSACAGAGADDLPRYDPPRPAPKPPVPESVSGPSSVQAEPQPGGAAEPATATPGDPEGAAAGADPTPAGEGGESPEAPPAPSPVVAWVAGTPIEAAELVTWLLHRDPDRVRDELGKLVGGRLALLEAQRLGLYLQPALVEEAYAARRGGFAGGVRELGSNLEPSEFVERELGLDAPRFFSMMRDEVVQLLITERVIRAWVLASERVSARVLMVRSAEDMAVAQAELDAGSPFEEVAKRHSVDRSAEEGGLVPYIMNLEQSPLSRLAHGAAEGEVVGPIELQGVHFLIQVLEKPTPVEGPWHEVAEAVEKSLAERDVEETEYLDWRLAMDGRYAIELRPFLELVGEPLPVIPGLEGE